MKKYVVSLMIFGLIIVFTGCTASSFNEMTKDERYEQRKYVVNENYQVVYKRALDMSKECHEMGMITAAQIADGEIYTELKKAEISLYLMGGYGRSMYHGALFEAIDDSHTNMTIYSRFGGEWFDILKREYTGECKSCLCDEENKLQARDKR
jgi:hypothetical protein